ncbi:MAG: Type IV pilus transmembrane protein FimT [uncultured bacterium]|jgi:type IV fimbrial biogenesis protein FimT|nr:MAG: Type IV pilus transmembrane protein FimT [uncultured bacterium]
MRTARHRNALGFTLIELMVTVAVLAVVVSLAAPSFRSILEAQRMRAAAFDLMGDLTLARSEALKRGQIATPITLTPASGNWAAGWSVMAGTDVVSTRNPVGSGVTITGPTTVVFDRNGRVSSTTTVARFALADSSATRKRCISLDPSGRPKSSTTGCAP